MQVDVVKAVVGAATMALITLCWMLGVGTLAVGPLGAAFTPVGVAAAVIAAVMGGLLVALLGRARAQVTAPSSSIAVIHAGLAAYLVAGPAAGRPLAEVWALMALCVVVAGLLLIMAGTLRASEAVHYLPLPVSIGFITGIGLLVIDTQLPSLLGGRPGLVLTVPKLLGAIEAMRPGAVLVGTLAALITWRATRHRHGAFGPVLALACGTAVHHALALLPGPAPAVGPTLGAVDLAAGLAWTAAALPSHASLEWLGLAVLDVLPFALVLAFQSAMNAAVTAASLGALLSTRTPVHRVLQAQGLANILCGAVGALPVCTNAPLSLLAVRFAPYPRMAAAACGFLLVAAVLASAAIAHLPLAAFAGVLMVSGARTIDGRIRMLAGRVWRGAARWQAAANLGVIATVAGMTVSGHGIAGVVLGLCMELLLFLKWLPPRPAAPAAVWRMPWDHWHAWQAVHAEALATPQCERVRVVPVGSTVFFGNVARLTEVLSRLPAGTTHVVVDLSRTHYMDLTAIHALDQALERMALEGVEALMCGLDHARQRPHALHLMTPGLLKRPSFSSAEAALATLAGPAANPGPAGRDTPALA